MSNLISRKKFIFSDPQDPPCPRLIVTGTSEAIPKNTPEYMFAKTALYTRHPNMMNYPKDHRFYFAKMNIDNVILLAAFGGATHVNVDDYFNATLSNYHWAEQYDMSNFVKRKPSKIQNFHIFLVQFDLWDFMK